MSGEFLSAELVGNVILVSDLLHNSDRDLFYKVCTPGHCLHDLLPPTRLLGYLCSHGYNFQLPEYHNELSKVIYYSGFV